MKRKKDEPLRVRRVARYTGIATTLTHAEEDVLAACRGAFHASCFPANVIHYEAAHELAPAIAAAINAAMDALGWGDSPDEAWGEALAALRGDVSAPAGETHK